MTKPLSNDVAGGSLLMSEGVFLMVTRLGLVGAAAAVLMAWPMWGVGAGDGEPEAALEAVVAEALTKSAELRALEERVRATEASVAPAGDMAG